jgi:hypothetical protein
MIHGDWRICRRMNPDRDDDLGEIADDGEPSVLDAPSLCTREYPLDSRGTLSVTRRFNRSTMWVGTGLLGGHDFRGSGARGPGASPLRSHFLRGSAANRT